MPFDALITQTHDVCVCPRRYRINCLHEGTLGFIDVHVHLFHCHMDVMDCVLTDTLPVYCSMVESLSTLSVSRALLPAVLLPWIGNLAPIAMINR